MLEDLEQSALVCLDDVERIAGKADWETAVFALCERLRASGGMLLVAGARPPRELGLQLPDLATRLGWGPVYALALLSDDERLEAIRLRARNRGTGNAGGGGALYSRALSARPRFAVRAARQT